MTPIFFPKLAFISAAANEDTRSWNCEIEERAYHWARGSEGTKEESPFARRALQVQPTWVAFEDSEQRGAVPGSGFKPHWWMIH